MKILNLFILYFIIMNFLITFKVLADPTQSGMGLRGINPRAGEGFGRLHSVDLDVGQGGFILKIGNEKFWFESVNAKRAFLRKYKRNCLLERTSGKNCECQRLLLEARMAAITHELDGVDSGEYRRNKPYKRGGKRKIKFRGKKYTKDQLIDEYTKLKDKAKNWHRYQKDIKGKKIGGKVCGNFDIYEAKSCPKRFRNTPAKAVKKSCGCRALYAKRNVDWATSGLTEIVKKLGKVGRGIKIGLSDPEKLIKTSLGILNSCEEVGIVACPPIIEDAPTDDPQNSNQQECSPLSHRVPTQVNDYIDRLNNIPKGDDEAENTELFNAENLTNFICKHGVPRDPKKVQDLINKSNLNDKEKDFLKDVSKLACFRPGAMGSPFCNHNKSGCEFLEDSKTSTLRKNLELLGKKQCLQNICEGFYYGYDKIRLSQHKKALNSKLDGLLIGVPDETSMSAYCEKALRRRNVEFPLKHPSSCAGLSDPAKGIVFGKKCKPFGGTSCKDVPNLSCLGGDEVNNKKLHLYLSCVARGQPTLDGPTTAHDCQHVYHGPCKPTKENDCKGSDDNMPSFMRNSKRPPIPASWSQDLQSFSLLPKKLLALQKSEVDGSKVLLKPELWADLSNGKMTKDFTVPKCMGKNVKEPISILGDWVAHGIIALAGGIGDKIIQTVQAVKDIRKRIKQERDDLDLLKLPTKEMLKELIKQFNTCNNKACDDQDFKKCTDLITNFDLKFLSYAQYWSKRCRVSRAADLVLSNFSPPVVPRRVQRALGGPGSDALQWTADEGLKLGNEAISCGSASQIYAKVSEGLKEDPPRATKLSPSFQAICQHYKENIERPTGESERSNRLNRFCGEMVQVE